MQQQSIHSSKYSISNQAPDFNLQENDPALEEHFQVVADMVLPLEIRQEKNGKTLNDTGSMEILRLRIMTGKDKESEEIKLELSSEEDLFFNFVCVLDKKGFNKLKKEQNLTIGFQSFVQMVFKLTVLAHTQKNTRFAIFCIRRDLSAHLDFNESVGYKFIEVLSLAFSSVDPQTNKQIVSHRFNLVKWRLQLLNNSIKEVNSIIKVKNPSLFQRLNKKNSHADA